MSSTKFIILDVSTDTMISAGFGSDACPRCNLVSLFDITNPNQTIHLLNRIFLDHLQVKSRECSVLLIENIFLQSSIRDMLVSILFKEFQVIVEVNVLIY